MCMFYRVKDLVLTMTSMVQNSCFFDCGAHIHMYVSVCTH